MSSKILFRLTSDKPFERVTESLEKLSPENQFRVLAVHDVQATLAEKGFERGPLKIIEICNAGFAHQALKMTPDVALFMPCRFTVYTENNKTIVNLAKPSMIAEMMPEAGLEELATDIENRLIDIMKRAV